ncbi:MAG TPA: alpha/beta fold hydrolase [Blastocatellia bacterium]|nr:alpha/beta fold hydrolase [Blastocatellia bacterium]
MLISKKKLAAFKRVFWVFVPAVLVLVVGVGALDFYVVHRMTHPPRTSLYGSPRDFQVILKRPMWFDDTWKNSDATQSSGWFLSQGKPGPVVILSHGYGSNRSELLTLGFELWKAGYHVLLYDMRGHGESSVKWSGLGTYEKDDLLSAIKFLKSKKANDGQPLIDGRVGLYGVDMGGYISLVASSQDPSVKAVAVDSVYPDMNRFINNRLKTFIGTDSSAANSLVDSHWTSDLTGLALQLYLMRREDSAPAVESVAAVTGSKLFMKAKNTGAFEALTLDLYTQAKDPKKLVEVEYSRVTRLYGKASADYDAEVVAFFLDAVPLSASKAGPLARAN